MNNSRKVAAAVLIILTLSFGLRAQTEALSNQLAALKLVPPEFVPESGTFYSLQKAEEQPPLPFNPFPNLPVYWLGDDTFLIDDSSVDFVFLQEQSAANASAMSPAGADQANSAWESGVGVGCGLWLSISVTNDTATLTLHNTRTGQTYTVWTTEDLSITFTNWSVETNLTGASGDFTETLIAMGNGATCSSGPPKTATTSPTQFSKGSMKQTHSNRFRTRWALSAPAILSS